MSIFKPPLVSMSSTDALTLNGKTENQLSVDDSAHLNGNTSGDFAGATGTSSNSFQIGGQYGPTILFDEGDYYTHLDSVFEWRDIGIIKRVDNEIEVPNRWFTTNITGWTVSSGGAGLTVNSTSWSNSTGWEQCSTCMVINVTVSAEYTGMTIAVNDLIDNIKNLTHGEIGIKVGIAGTFTAFIQALNDEETPIQDFYFTTESDAAWHNYVNTTPMTNPYSPTDSGYVVVAFNNLPIGTYDVKVSAIRLFKDYYGYLYVQDNGALKIAAASIVIADDIGSAPEYEIWHAGNLDPSSFATTGDIESISKLSYVTPESGNPYLKWITPDREDRNTNIVKIKTESDSAQIEVCGDFDNHYSNQYAELNINYEPSYSSSRCNVCANDANISLHALDNNGTPSAELTIEIDDGDLYSGVYLTPTSFEFSDGDDTLAEFATTGITIGGNHVPVYYGSLASAPTGISAGDEYYNTGDSKFYKYNGSSWVALN